MITEAIPSTQYKNTYTAEHPTGYQNESSREARGYLERGFSVHLKDYCNEQ